MVETILDSVIVILPSCDHLKVFNTIILLVAILVVYLFITQERFDECIGDQSMHRVVLTGTSICKVNMKIAIPPDSGGQNTGDFRPRRARTSPNTTQA